MMSNSGTRIWYQLGNNRQTEADWDFKKVKGAMNMLIASKGMLPQ